MGRLSMKDQAGRNPMKLLHTSDWHIGRALYSRKRYEEFEAFPNWLAILLHGIASRVEN